MRWGSSGMSARFGRWSRPSRIRRARSAPQQSRRSALSAIRRPFRSSSRGCRRIRDTNASASWTHSSGSAGSASMPCSTMPRPIARTGALSPNCWPSSRRPVPCRPCWPGAATRARRSGHLPSEPSAPSASTIARTTICSARSRTIVPRCVRRPPGRSEGAAGRTRRCTWHRIFRMHGSWPPRLRALRDLGAAGRNALEHAAASADGELARQVLWECGAATPA
jgi:hypothetical protein